MERSLTIKSLSFKETDYQARHEYRLPVSVDFEGESVDVLFEVIIRRELSAENDLLTYTQIKLSKPNGDILFHLDEGFYPLYEPASMSATDAAISAWLKEIIKINWNKVVSVVSTVEADPSGLSLLQDLFV